MISKKPEITESMINRVEVAVRVYDPCLSCATHAYGRMPLEIEIYDSRENTIDRKRK
jgi:NAD-reducing hydrogenase large subunit